MALDLGGPGWRLVYDLGADGEQVAAIQRATLETEEYGVVPDPHLFGSDPWWDDILSGTKEVLWSEAAITSVYWAGMGDLPEFQLGAAERGASAWARKGDIRRYVEGVRVRVGHVQIQQRHPSAEGPSQHIIEVWIADCGARSSGIAPGPGGAGYARYGEGALVHYLRFEDEAAAHEATHGLRKPQVSVYRNEVPFEWWLQVLEPVTSWADVDEQRAAFAELAAAHAGTYDGSEIVGQPSSARGPLEL